MNMPQLDKTINRPFSTTLLRKAHKQMNKNLLKKFTLDAN